MGRYTKANEEGSIVRGGLPLSRQTETGQLLWGLVWVVVVAKVYEALVECREVALECEILLVTVGRA